MSGINSVAFNGYQNNVGITPKSQNTSQCATAFRGNNYPYYHEEPQKSKAVWVIGGTLAAVALAIGGIGYAHKTNALSKLSDGKIKDLLTKCEPAMKKCHEWCTWAKNTCKDGWDSVKSWFPKK